MFRRLEDYEDEGSSRKSGPVQPLRSGGPSPPVASMAAAAKLRDSALKSQAKLDAKLANGISEDLEGHLVSNGVTLQGRAQSKKDKRYVARTHHYKE